MENIAVKQLQDKIAFERSEHAYKLLFLHFYNGLQRFSLSILKSKEAAEEVVSDVMLKVWTMNENLNRVVDLKAFLYKAIKNAALNYLNSNEKHHCLDIENKYEAIGTDQYTPEEAMLKNEWSRNLLWAVQELPPKCRMVYKLIREDGYSYKEVAAIMHISENTVDRHLNNALHKLIYNMRIYLGVNRQNGKKNLEMQWGVCQV